MKIKKNKCKKKKVSQGGIKKRCNYDKDNLLRAINIVKHGESIAAASRRYNIPESTIRAHVKGKYSMKKPGPHTVLSETEEKNLVKWIFHKMKKEQDEIKKKEEKLRREELKLQKESDKIKKQEERLKKMETLKIKKEEELRKKQEAVEIRNQLERLKVKEAELRKQCETEITK